MAERQSNRRRSLPFVAEALGTLIFLVSFWGCSHRPDDDPRAAVAALLEHLRAGRYDDAWPLILSSDQERLMQAHRRLAEAEGRVPDETPAAALADLRLVVGAEPQDLTLASRPGPVVRVRVTLAAGKGATFQVRKDENQGWRVSLLENLPARAPEDNPIHGQSSVPTSSAAESRRLR